jgi:hypothetical protein
MKFYKESPNILFYLWVNFRTISVWESHKKLLAIGQKSKIETR